MLRLSRRLYSLGFENKVALVTGAGNGLGREYALELGRRGATVIVNDIGGDVHGTGTDTSAVDKVCLEIEKNGGQSFPLAASVEDTTAIMGAVKDNFGRIDVLINNAGILRDKGFLRITESDLTDIISIHLTSAFKLTQQSFAMMKEQKYGRVVNTTSASGLYGNFGQANYAAAKMALVGFSKTVALEGKKHNINCNAIAPIAASRMTEGILPDFVLEKLDPKYVVPFTLYLCHEKCEESGGVFEVGGGWCGKVRTESARGSVVKPNGIPTIEDVEAKFEEICDFEDSLTVDSLQEASMRMLAAVMEHED